MLELKIDKGTEYITGWKSKGVYNSKLIALHGAFSPNVKYFGNKIEIRFSSTPLVIAENNYATKIVNVYMVYVLDNWPKNQLRNFTLKNCFFWTTNTLKIIIIKSMCIVATEEHLMEKVGGVLDFARNVIIFGVDNIIVHHLKLTWFLARTFFNSLFCILFYTFLFCVMICYQE